MKKKDFSDRSHEHRIFMRSSRKLYLPFKRYRFKDFDLITGNLSGCSLSCCPFHFTTCHHCLFEF